MKETEGGGRGKGGGRTFRSVSFSLDSADPTTVQLSLLDVCNGALGRWISPELQLVGTPGEWNIGRRASRAAVAAASSIGSSLGSATAAESCSDILAVEAAVNGRQ